MPGKVESFLAVQTNSSTKAVHECLAAYNELFELADAQDFVVRIQEQTIALVLLAISTRYIG